MCLCARESCVRPIPLVTAYSSRPPANSWPKYRTWPYRYCHLPPPARCSHFFFSPSTTTSSNSIPKPSPETNFRSLRLPGSCFRIIHCWTLFWPCWLFSISFSAPPTSTFFHTSPCRLFPHPTFAKPSLSLNTYQPPRTIRPFSTRSPVWLVYRTTLSSVWQFRCIYCGLVTFVHRQLPCYHNAHATPFEFCFRRRWQRPRP